MDDKTGAQLDDHEVRTYLEFAGERAYITGHEMVSIYCWNVRLECKIYLFGFSSFGREISPQELQNLVLCIRTNNVT